MEGTSQPPEPPPIDAPLPPPAGAPAVPPPVPGPPPESAPVGPPPLDGTEHLGAPPPLPDPGRLPDPGPMRHDYQSYNEQQEVSVTPCANCASPMEFNIGYQQLWCPACGFRSDVVHPEGAEVHEQSLQALWAGGPRSKNYTHEPDEKEIVCQSCGGHTTFVGTLTTTKCPYCATDIARTDVHEAPDRLSVDGVLPFTITAKEAQKQLNDWIGKRWFAPNEYKKYSTHGSFESVYAAYFTYDAEATTDYDGQRGTRHTRTVGHGDNRRTETYTTWSRASGQVFNSFDDITVLANTGFEKRFVDKLEPWPTHQVQPYHPDYITGHLCRTYDHDVEQCSHEARQFMEQTVTATVNRDIGGDEQRIDRMNMRLSNQTYKHVLLPIWLLTVLYDGRAMQVFMNGTTGEIHGERPWSKVKIIAAVAAVVVVIVLLLILRSMAGN